MAFPCAQVLQVWPRPPTSLQSGRARGRRAQQSMALSHLVYLLSPLQEFLSSGCPLLQEHGPTPKLHCHVVVAEKSLPLGAFRTARACAPRSRTSLSSRPGRGSASRFPSPCLFPGKLICLVPAWPWPRAGTPQRSVSSAELRDTPARSAGEMTGGPRGAGPSPRLAKEEPTFSVCPVMGGLANLQAPLPSSTERAGRGVDIAPPLDSELGFQVMLGKPAAPSSTYGRLSRGPVPGAKGTPA